MVDIPKIKKKVNAFLVGEEGRISKESLIKTGAIVTMFALGALKSAKADVAQTDSSHTNEMGFVRTKIEPMTVDGSHRNEYHNNHSSHSSHGSHCSTYECCHWW